MPCIEISVFAARVDTERDAMHRDKRMRGSSKHLMLAFVISKKGYYFIRTFCHQEIIFKKIFRECNDA